MCVYVCVYILMYCIDIDFHLIIIGTYTYLWLFNTLTHTCVLTVPASLWVFVCTSLCVCVSRQQMATKLPQASVQTTCFPNLMIMSYLWVNTQVCVSVSLHSALHSANGWRLPPGSSHICITHRESVLKVSRIDSPYPGVQG